MTVKKLTQQLKEANEANEAILKVIEQLNHELAVERAKVRIPTKLSAHQFTEIVEHCHKVRDGFVKALLIEIPKPIAQA